MRWLHYHDTIAKTFPKLVEEYVNLEENLYETYNIGDIQGGVILTHIIKYKLPYSLNGIPCFLTLGLTEDLPLDTLYGVGLQRSMKLNLDLGNDVAYSGLFQQHYPLEFKPPRRSPLERIASQQLAPHKAFILQTPQDE